MSQQENTAIPLSIPAPCIKGAVGSGGPEGRRRPTASCVLRFTLGNLYKILQDQVF